MQATNWYKVFDDWDAARRAVPLNTMRKATIMGRSICIVNYGGTFHVVDDLCPHMRASLSQGKLNAFGEIICPLHHYRFHLINGLESEMRCNDLEVHQIAEQNGEIFIVLRI